MSTRCKHSEQGEAADGEVGADGTESGGDSQCKVTPGCALLAQPIYDRTHGTEHRLIPAVGPGFPLPATSHRTAAESVVCVQGLQLFQSTLNVSPHRYTRRSRVDLTFPRQYIAAHSLRLPEGREGHRGLLEGSAIGGQELRAHAR